MWIQYLCKTWNLFKRWSTSIQFTCNLLIKASFSLYSSWNGKKLWKKCIEIRLFRVQFWKKKLSRGTGFGKMKKNRNPIVRTTTCIMELKMSFLVFTPFPFTCINRWFTCTDGNFFFSTWQVQKWLKAKRCVHGLLTGGPVWRIFSGSGNSFPKVVRVLFFLQTNKRERLGI